MVKGHGRKKANDNFSFSSAAIPCKISMFHFPFPIQPTNCTHMSFEKGNVSFRIFHLKNGLKQPDLAKFAEHVAPSIETLSTSPIEGWVSWRHLLDYDVSEEKCFFPPLVHLNLLHAEKKVPGGLLRAFCKLEEDAQCRARNLEFLSKKERAEIKKTVFEQMQPEMPPTLSGLPLVVDVSCGRVLAEALSKANLERFGKLFVNTTREQPYLMTPEVAALLRKQINATDLDPSLFTDEPGVDPEAACSLGLEFLTWLWYLSETGETQFKSAIGESCVAYVTGPLTFYREGKGAHEALLRKGAPNRSREAFTALLCGKQLKRAKFYLAIQDKLWECTLDSEFCFRGLKLPKDPENKRPTFQDRMTDVSNFLRAFFDLYDQFLDLRGNSKSWNALLRKFRKLLRDRLDSAQGETTQGVDDGNEVDVADEN